MPTRKETHLDRKLRQLGMSPDKSSGNKRLYFKLYFPRPPHGQVEYRAAKLKDGYNFVGLVLGHGGATLQRIQRQTGTKIEIHDQTGNLNGAHPMANDPTLHALITADCKDKLINGVMMVAEALEPVNTSFEKIHVEVNGSALLVPVLKERLGSEEGEGEGLSYGSLSPPGSRSSSPRGTTSSDTVAWWKPQDLRMGLNRQQMPQQNYQPLHNYQKPQANGGSTFSSTDSMCSNSSEHGTLFCPPEAKQQRHEGLWQAGGGSLWPFPSYSYQDPNKTAAPTLPFSQPWSSFVGGDQGVYGAFGASRCVETNYDPLVVQGLGSLVDSLREEVCTLGGWSPVVPQQKVEEDTSVDRLMELLVQPQS